MFGANSIATIPLNAKTVPFPMVDPFGPVRKARIPVPGLNRFPGRYNRLGPRYYGVEAPVVVNGGDEGNEENYRGLGFAPLPGVTVPSGSLEYPSSVSSSSGGLWQSILNAVQVTLPATISAIKGQPYYNPGQTIQQQGIGLPSPVGYAGASSGADIGASAGAGLGGFVDSLARNPGTVLLIGGAALLLFMRPPGRR